MQKSSCLNALVAAAFFFMPLFMPAGTASAQTALISGAYLLEICKRDENGGELTPGSHAACQAYIAGLVDYHNLIQSLGTSPSVDICIPANVKLNDLQDIVWKYLETNAQHDAFIAAPAVALALFEVFPCVKGK